MSFASIPVQVCWIVDVYVNDRTERLYVASQMYLLVLSDDVTCHSRSPIALQQLLVIFHAECMSTHPQTAQDDMLALTGFP